MNKVQLNGLTIKRALASSDSGVMMYSYTTQVLTWMALSP